MSTTLQSGIKVPTGNDNNNRQSYEDNLRVIDGALVNVKTDIGTLANLNTAVKTDVVSAINEVNGNASMLYTSTNAGNAYSITAVPAITAYADGQIFRIKVNADSTGNTTLNVNGKGAKNILKANGANVTNLKLNGVYTVVYSSGNFILQGEGASGNLTASDLRSGKTATGDAGEVVGTLTDNGVVTITPLTVDQSLNGIYNAGSKVPGDADLVPENIKQGVNIFGVDGSCVPYDLSIHKKYATGSTTLDSNYYCNVSGLSFTARMIVVKTAGYNYIYNPTNLSALCQPMGASYNYSGHTITSTGFNVKVGEKTVACTWFAWE